MVTTVFPQRLIPYDLLFFPLCGMWLCFWNHFFWLIYSLTGGRGRVKSIGPFIKQLTGSSRHLLVPVLADAGNGPINHGCSHWAGLYVSSTIFHQVWWSRVQEQDECPSGFSGMERASLLNAHGDSLIFSPSSSEASSFLTITHGSVLFTLFRRRDSARL